MKTFWLKQKKLVGTKTSIFLICAVAFNHDLPIFTLDKDFSNFSKHINIKLLKIS